MSPAPLDLTQTGPAAPPPERAWSASLVAFGAPSAPHTFSGYSRSLADGLRAHGHLRHEYSARQLVPLDVFRGVVGLTWRAGLPRPTVRRGWMWSARGIETLSQRLARRIEQRGDRGNFLQVGTLVHVPAELGPHYMLTDMTIAQARQAGYFAIADLPVRALDQAERLQCDLLAEARHVFALSSWTADSLIHDCGVPPAHVTIVYAGPNLVVPPGLKEARAEGEILFVGVDWERKGGPPLLEAVRRLRRRLPDARLRVIGCGPPLDEPGVQVDGFLNRADPAQYEMLVRAYLRASCFCVPSRFDPFPNALIEAASVGLPAVAFDNGSRREAIEHGRTGYLVPVDDVEGLADALHELLGNPARCREMGELARRRAQRLFTWERVVGRIGSAIQETGVTTPPEARA
jgi:glycosyltransferase involved in cell wall biosynthesis